MSLYLMNEFNGTSVNYAKWDRIPPWNQGTNLITSTYDSKLYQSVTIGGANCNSTISNQNNLSIYATDYILLNEGVSIDNQSNVVFNTENCQNNQFGIKSLKSLRQTTPNPLPPAFLERIKRYYQQ